MADYWREFHNDAFNVLTQGSRMSTSEWVAIVTLPEYRNYANLTDNSERRSHYAKRMYVINRRLAGLMADLRLRQTSCKNRATGEIRTAARLMECDA